MSPQRPEPQLRASDADRERAVERLHSAAVEGRLDSDELEDRVAAAYAARWTSELTRLTADVTPPPAAAPMPFPAYARAPQPRPVTNGLAVASLVAAVIWLFWLGAICAVIFGHTALRQIKASDGRQTGTGLAIAGLVIGYLELLALVARIAAPG